jgi:hypothetical protein
MAEDTQHASGDKGLKPERKNARQTLGGFLFDNLCQMLVLFRFPWCRWIFHPSGQEDGLILWGSNPVQPIQRSTIDLNRPHCRTDENRGVIAFQTPPGIHYCVVTMQMTEKPKRDQINQN